MKIENAQIYLGSTHQYAQHHEVEESLIEGTSKPGTVWSADNLENGSVYQHKESHDYLELSTEAQFMQLSQSSMKAPDFLPSTDSSLRTEPSVPVIPTEFPKMISGIAPTEAAVEITPPHEARLQLLIAMIEVITGKKFDFSNIRHFKQPEEAANKVAQEMVNPSAVESNTSEYGFAYHYSETYSESEQTQFNAQGIIHTADGKEINISLELNMSREFTRHHNIDIRAGAAEVKDPLVINFNGASAQLTEEKFSFDIDNDGTEDQISFVGPNSGFLALDNNQDGIINNGSELFGALSGNGFAELAQYDEDNNNFIDENDRIYNKLRIWTQSNEGNQQLIALGQAGIGAIYLGYTSTPFEIKDANNQLQGVVKSSSIYLSDDGLTGSVQQLDLVV
jgi:hypothetical protein